jgi:hypothetical protein
MSGNRFREYPSLCKISVPALEKVISFFPNLLLFRGRVSSFKTKCCNYSDERSDNGYVSHCTVSGCSEGIVNLTAGRLAVETGLAAGRDNDAYFPSYAGYGFPTAWSYVPLTPVDWDTS